MHCTARIYSPAKLSTIIGDNYVIHKCKVGRYILYLLYLPWLELFACKHISYEGD